MGSRGMMIGLSRVGMVLLSVAVLAVAGCGTGGDPSDFVVAADSAPITVMADYTTPAITLNVKPINSFNANITFTAVPPAGFTCNPSCTITSAIAGDPTTPLVFHFDTASTLAAAVYPIVFHGVEGKMQHDVTVPITITAFNGVPPPPDFDFTVDPAYQVAGVVGRGVFNDNTQYSLTFTRYNHYTGPILGVATFDAYTACKPVACTFVDTTDMLLAPFIISTAPISGQHPILFTATAGSVTKTVTVLINVVIVPVPTPPPGAGGGVVLPKPGR